MMSYLSSFLSPADYIPHGICLAWQPELIALHVGSDAAIAIAYYSIPFALIYFVLKRADLAFPGLFVLTGAFILACGTTHVMSIVTLWQPDYRLEGIIKLITAVASVASAVAMWHAMPLALALPSTTQLEQVNRSLAGEIAGRERAQAALRDMNAELERRVALRTAELQEEVAQRKRSEAYLAEAQQLSHTGSFGWNVSSGEIFWSEESFRIFGYDTNSVPSIKMVLERVHPDDVALVQQVIDRAVNDDQRDFDHEYRLMMPDESVKHLHVVARAVRPETGKLQFVGAVMDITDRIRAQEMLQQLRAEFAHAARVSMLGELTASIAHEVKQPITATVANAAAALKWLSHQPPDVEEARQTLARILKDGTRAGHVVDRTRDLIKKAPPRREPLQINEPIREVIELTRGETAKNGILVRTELADSLPFIQGDRVQLQQVMVNLIINAVDAMGETNEGSRELLISTEKSDSGNVLVAVRDSGPGLAPATLDHLFDALYTTKPKGLGLGLSICRSIIEEHGGRLWASANEPRGAVFQFTVPIAARMNS